MPAAVAVVVAVAHPAIFRTPQIVVVLLFVDGWRRIVGGQLPNASAILDDVDDDYGAAGGPMAMMLVDAVVVDGFARDDGKLASPVVVDELAKAVEVVMAAAGNLLAMNSHR